MRDNWLSNRVFQIGRDIVDHCCDAWNKLVDQPWTIMSIGPASVGPWVLINAGWYNLLISIESWSEVGTVR